MPTIETGEIQQYYETTGEGTPLVLVHGAFVDLHMWDPQVEHFADRYQVICYDLRGHGKTGPSSASKYRMEMFADDLRALLEALDVQQTILCGLSLGGMIAQAFAVKYPSMLKALVLADTAVSTSLTLNDKFQRYILFPKWMMVATIRLMGVERFTRYSFWLAKVTRSEAWLGRDEGTRSYLEDRMLRITMEEYLKIYDAIYEFDIVDLGTIAVPALITIGEHESGSVYRHAEEMRRLIPGSQKIIVPGAGHTSNLEKPAEFNAILDEFLASIP
ncbi:MAG: hypothetical protein AMJ88_06970 [Anaerolineae bacterium SM23_ 63]|nr:MAG: hypothetical protein AMJ88_06970 [Anaerolineae bacterium SM23_ 63]HEY46876.1 alpha/beta fold hydrolase [Anaerolineae bacterium]